MSARGARLTKPQRQHRIQRLLEDQAVSTQEQLVELLAVDGVVATQATVSRDLEDLGAIKVRVPGGETVYAVPAMPKDAVAPEEHLRRVCSEWVVEVAHSGNIVVLPPQQRHALRRRAHLHPVRAAQLLPQQPLVEHREVRAVLHHQHAGPGALGAQHGFSAQRLENGNTLVVDTVGFLPGTLRGVTPHSDQMHVVERITPEIETAIYRVAQESLTNIIRHARATRCDISAEYRDGALHCDGATSAADRPSSL